MSLAVTIEYEGGDELASLTASLKDRAGMHRRIAADALSFVREFGAQKSADEHRTATNLGARPTGHLSDAYRGIESEHDEVGAALLVPRASRLRAAFGDHTITPKNSKYLTIPVNKDSYGKRAGEFEDLFFIRSGPSNTALLVRRVEGERDRDLNNRPNQRRKTERGNQLETMYLLVTSSDIKEDASLIPFEEIYEGAADSVEAFLDEALERGLA